jgi:nicotinate phosphoribosyltransferase
VDPLTKTIVFSDGLDIDVIEELYEYFNGRINVVFGWGTTLTNDLGIPPLNIVMKAVAVDGTETVKLSDVPTKHTGNPKKVAQYEHEFAVAVAA